MKRRPAFAANIQRLVVGMLRLNDIAVVVVAGITAYWLRHGEWLPAYYLGAIAIGAFATANYLQLAGIYRLRHLTDFSLQSEKLAATWLAVALTLMALAYFTKTSELYSRVWLGLWLAMSFAGFIAARAILNAIIQSWHRQGKLFTNLALVGAPDHCARLRRHLDSQAVPGLRVLGIFSDGMNEAGDETADETGANADVLDDLIERVRANEIDEVAICLPDEREERLLRILDRLKEVPVDIKLAPGALALTVPPGRFSFHGTIPFMGIYERPLEGWDLVFKALEDRVLGFLIFVMMLPAMAVIALLIKATSPGPVFFRQTRYGFNSNPIEVLKFRTMHHRAETATVPQATRDDRRITPVGKILRRTSLDELPQLINVIRGEMSLVGPRPHAVAHNEYYATVIDQYLMRHRVKPGITGWAQVNGFRGETDTPEKMRIRIQYDIYYIEHWSIFFDLRILAMTPFVGFVHKNAY